MTCIIGLVENGKVYIGGDSAGCADGEIRATKIAKVFQNGNFLIGFTTSFRMGQLLQYQLNVPSHTDGISDGAYMVRVFIETVRKLFTDYGFARIDSNEESAGKFLVAYRGHLYCVESDYQVQEHLDGFEVIGAGRSYALGGLKAMETLEMSPTERILKALQVSAYFSDSVIEPFKILSI
jgi:ATP-dependent protease HslVU (ClpYQ) peptidase subunit